jgi:hypothetical protein
MLIDGDSHCVELPTRFEDDMNAEMGGRTESMYGVRPPPICENPPLSFSDLVALGGTEVDRPSGWRLENAEPGGLESSAGT